MSISADDIMVTFDERFNTHEHAYCTCPKCGKQADVDTSKVLTSYPPKYMAVCPHCGEVFYPFCSQVDFAIRETEMKETIESLLAHSVNDGASVATTTSSGQSTTATINIKENLANSKLYKRCFICGEAIREINQFEDLMNAVNPQTEICENCRAAILEMRKKMRKKK